MQREGSLCHERAGEVSCAFLWCRARSTLSPATTRTKSVRLHQVWRPASVDEGEDGLPDRGRGQDAGNTSGATMVARDADEDVADQSSAATRITLRPHDPRTGEEIEKREIVKGYEYNRGQFVTFTTEELKALDVESSKVIDLEKFLTRNDIDPVYFDSPYYVYPDGPIAVETLRVIGAAMAEAGVAGLGRLTLSRRERMVMIEPRGTGMALFTLRAAAEVRASQFDSANGDLDAEMVAIAGAIIRQRTGKFDPGTFRDGYQEALQQLGAVSTPSPVIDLMAALKRSLAEEAPTQKRSAASRQKPNRAAPDRRQAALLLPLSGRSKRNGERSAGPATIGTRRRRKA